MMQQKVKNNLHEVHNRKLSCEEFFNHLVQKKINFFTGVPDSLLKDFCGYISDNVCKSNHVISTNEGSSIGLAIGYHLSTGKIPLIYMQNSGLGNIINPLLSLADSKVYKIPLILMIGWRGEPGFKDEPQHYKQGEVTTDLLESIGVDFSILPENISSAKNCIDKLIKDIKHTSSPHALIVKKNTFSDYVMKNDLINNYEMSREDAIQIVLKSLKDDSCVVSTTGKASREVYEYRKFNNLSHEKDFLTVGGMGHTSQIALGIALNSPQKKVICIDGDGSVLMHLGGLGIIGDLMPRNFIHIIINNESHDSVGGQPTIGYNINFSDLCKSLNYKHNFRVKSKKDLEKILSDIDSLEGPISLEILTKKGARNDLGRPDKTPVDNKNDFMKFLNK